MDTENNQGIVDSVKSKSLVKFQVILVACNFMIFFNENIFHVLGLRCTSLLSIGV